MILTVLIPLKDESSNIPKIKSLIDEFSKKQVNFLLCVDKSSDDTLKLCKSLESKSVVTIENRSKPSFSRNIITGINYLRTNSKNEYFLIFDADLQWPKEIISKNLEIIKNQSPDVIINSRYLSKSKIKYGGIRRLVSVTSNMLVRFVTGMHYRDITGGCKCYKTSILNFKLQSCKF